LPAEFAESFKLPIRDGVLITVVLLDGPAGRSGLKPGDVVTAVGERPVANTVQLLNAVAALKPGSEATLGVQRGPDVLQLKITVGRRPPSQRRAPQ
jgi:serine protease DegQ